MLEFLPSADNGKIVIKTGEQQLLLAAAEADKATKLIGIALGMETMDALPDHITNSPFVIRFSANGTLSLERQDESGSISFEWADADDLIVAIQKGLNISIDKDILTNTPKETGSISYNSEPFI